MSYNDDELSLIISYLIHKSIKRLPKEPKNIIFLYSQKRFETIFDSKWMCEDDFYLGNDNTLLGKVEDVGKYRIRIESLMKKGRLKNYYHLK